MSFHFHDLIDHIYRQIEGEGLLGTLTKTRNRKKDLINVLEEKIDHDADEIHLYNDYVDENKKEKQEFRDMEDIMTEDQIEGKEKYFETKKEVISMMKPIIKNVAKVREEEMSLVDDLTKENKENKEIIKKVLLKQIVKPKIEAIRNKLEDRKNEKNERENMKEEEIDQWTRDYEKKRHDRFLKEKQEKKEAYDANKKGKRITNLSLLGGPKKEDETREDFYERTKLEGETMSEFEKRKNPKWNEKYFDYGDSGVVDWIEGRLNSWNYRTQTKINNAKTLEYVDNYQFDKDGNFLDDKKYLKGTDAEIEKNLKNDVENFIEASKEEGKDKVSSMLNKGFELAEYNDFNFDNSIGKLLEFLLMGPLRNVIYLTTGFIEPIYTNDINLNVVKPHREWMIFDLFQENADIECKAWVNQKLIIGHDDITNVKIQEGKISGHSNNFIPWYIDTPEGRKLFNTRNIKEKKWVFSENFKDSYIVFLLKDGFYNYQINKSDQLKPDKYKDWDIDGKTYKCYTLKPKEKYKQATIYKNKGEENFIYADKKNLHKIINI